MSPHPALRVLGLVAAVIVLPLLAPTVLAVILVLAVTTHLAGGPNALRAWLVLCRRARWLLASVFLLHLVSVAGVPAFPALGAWSPSQSGLDLALERTGLLLTTLTLVSLLLVTTPVPSLLAGLHALLAPGERFGLPASRIARRLAWTLDELTVTREALDEARARNQAEPLTALVELVVRAEQGIQVRTAEAAVAAWRRSDLGWMVLGVLVLVLLLGVP